MFISISSSNPVAAFEGRRSQTFWKSNVEDTVAYHNNNLDYSWLMSFPTYIAYRLFRHSLISRRSNYVVHYVAAEKRQHLTVTTSAGKGVKDLFASVFI